MIYPTIAIIGAGRVGTTTAYTLMLKNLAAQILLIDADVERCKGEFLDLEDVLLFSATSSIQDATLSQAAQADIIIITAGIAQKLGQTRLELLQTNKKIMDNVIESLTPINPNAIILVVSNPMDILTLYIQEKKVLPRSQIFGSGTLLDSMRLRQLIAKKLSVSPQSIHAWILGEHGDSQFPAWSLAHCDGQPLSEIPAFNQQSLEQLAEQTKQKAYEIINCKGSTFYGIASSLALIVQSILYNDKMIIPISWYYEEFGICMSKLCVIGKKGIENVWSIKLNQNEQELLAKSAQELKKIIDF